MMIDSRRRVGPRAGGVLVLFLCVLVSAPFGRALGQSAPPMTNADVVSLVKAKLAENTILAAVRAAKPAFDTSAGALIKLTSDGVPQAVIEAMISAASKAPRNDGAADAAPPVAAPRVKRPGELDPDDVFLINGAEVLGMKYLTPRMRGKYIALEGPRAALRIVTGLPAFLIAIPGTAQPASYIDLVNFAVRDGGAREVAVDARHTGVIGPASSGILRDRVVATRYEKYGDQSKAPGGFIVYKVTPAAPLMEGGEYAIVLFGTAARARGAPASPLDGFFDFGVVERPRPPGTNGDPLCSSCAR